MFIPDLKTPRIFFSDRRVWTIWKTIGNYPIKLARSKLATTYNFRQHSTRANPSLSRFKSGAIWFAKFEPFHAER